MSPVTLFTALRQEQNKEVLKKLVIATLAMVVLPVATFFAVKASHVKSNPESADMWGGFAAVVMANVVIVSYVVMAFNEPEPEGAIGAPKPPATGIWAAKKTD